ncbi:elongation factor P hydroxylase [Oceanicoccus sagamiensis]|uniref:Diaminobutyrate-2-oxoglutarate aminotransferase n=1 Tax=Oceanicoccus sagamiensis TaxID=716816 RepID=A0A1X9NJF6_9GAMM|nr:elongation factor P hydroxylase [Oceanicoccus sagamiensis]ARN76492.1 diaminobutyrate-2-oxoglutarate aminotransferase [Oceanicoccus sagamiensis]
MSEHAVQSLPLEHSAADVITLFDGLFAEAENTRLVKGEQEPIYIPASADCDYHQIVFAHGFFSSALHEIAHWCIAGKERRQQLDYGYWYAPDGRDQQQQYQFEQVEVKPQALEWILSKACQKSFRISADNLNGVDTDDEPFKSAVYQQAVRYCEQGLPLRAKLLVATLANFYQTAIPETAHFQFVELG